MPAQAGSIPRDFGRWEMLPEQQNPACAKAEKSKGKRRVIFYFLGLTFPSPDPLAEIPEVKGPVGAEHPRRAGKASQLHSPAPDISKECWKEASP